MTIGGIDSSKYTGNLTYASLPAGSGSTWQLASPQIVVNGKTTSTLKSSRDIIFDSGTSNVLFDTDVAEVMSLIWGLCWCWLCHYFRLSTPLSRPTLNLSALSQELMESHARKFPLCLPRLTLGSSRQPERPLTWPFRVASWALAHSQAILRPAKHSLTRSMGLTLWAVVSWNTITVFGMLVANAWALRIMVRISSTYMHSDRLLIFSSRSLRVLVALYYTTMDEV